MKKTKVLIIGSGPSGWSAAVYAARANLHPILITGSTPGGQLTITTDVENYPGFADIIQGPWLMEQMEKQAINVGTEVIRDHVAQVDFSQQPFVAITEKGDKYLANTVIISTGATARWLGLESEKKYLGYGVSGCATCDAFFYKGKDVVIVGGGNAAVEEAMYLTKFASQVTLIHRRNALRAEKVLQDRLFANPKIKIIWDHAIDEILGEDNPLGVTGVRIKDLNSGVLTELKTHGVFIAIGHIPNSSIFEKFLELDQDKYICTKPNSTQTNIPGVFAAGDVQDKIYRQAITAAGTGCMAALEVEKYLSH